MKKIKGNKEDDIMIENQFINDENLLKNLKPQLMGNAQEILKLKGKTNKPFYVSSMYMPLNIDLKQVYEKHNNEHNLVTMICVQKTIEVPYEVLEIGNSQEISLMQTNPRFTFIISAGAYVIEPRFLEFIPKEPPSTIEDVIKYCLRKNEKIGVFMAPSLSFKDIRKTPLFID